MTSHKKGDGKWMQKAAADMKKGSLRATARREGLIKGSEKLSKTDLNKLSESKSPVTRKRAALAKTFAKARGK